jgi:tetratricopeptide (TPR) repeat protein
MLTANPVRSERRCLLVRALTLGALMGGCLASVRQAQAQSAALDYYNQGVDWAKKGEHDRAIADFDQAIKLDPNYAYAYNNRGNAWQNKGEDDKAIADFNQAIRLAPNEAKVYNNRAWAWCKKKDYDRALADCNQAIKLDPNFAAAYYIRGYAWKSKKDYDRATADFNQAIRLDPNDAYAYNFLAALQATCPEARFRDGQKAVENATRAYQLSEGRYAMYLDTLAAAYAETGDFDSAGQWQAKAIELSTSEKEKQDFRSRLKLYKQKKPCRQAL